MQILATSPLYRVLCCPCTTAGARSSQLCLAALKHTAQSCSSSLKLKITLTHAKG